MTAVTMVSLESAQSTHHQLINSFANTMERTCTPDGGGMMLPSVTSVDHQLTSTLSQDSSSSEAAHNGNNSVHQQNIALRRQNRRHKLKLDITAASHYHRVCKMNLLSPSQSSDISDNYLMMPNVSFSQGLKPIENQITNPNFVRFRKSVCYFLTILCSESIFMCSNLSLLSLVGKIHT